MSKPSPKFSAVKALERNGKVNVNDLIAAAKDPEHPCHNDFTWDVKQAAMERWRDQARGIIRSFHFDVVVEDVTTPVVYYVPSTDDDAQRFVSLPRIKSTSKTNELLVAEVNMLHGIASRVFGIALAKQNMVGGIVVSQLRAVCDQIEAIRDSLSEN